MNKRKEFRSNDDTNNKIKKIRELQPENYPNDSMVIRAGIHYLYNEKIKKGKADPTIIKDMKQTRTHKDNIVIGVKQ